MRPAKVVLLMLIAAGVVYGSVFAALKTYTAVEKRALLDRNVSRAQGLLLPAALQQASGTDFRVAARKIMPSVVSIDTSVRARGFFQEEAVERRAGSGSGVIVSEDGYVVTNNHVVRTQSWRGRQTLVDKVTVILSDGRRLAARIVGTDARADIAVLKLDAANLDPIEMGDSSKLETGEWVIAVGNPLGYENTLSVGVVSNVGRPIPGDAAVFIDGIQTDAAINQGNSGGALCNAAGQLVGINAAIASIGGGNIGIGFAIPVNRMRTVVSEIVKTGRVRYGSLGVTLFRDETALASQDGRDQLQELTSSQTPPPSRGLVIVDVQQGSGADKAGIERLDVLTAINGASVDGLEEFLVATSPRKPGETLRLKLWQKGRIREVSVTLGEASAAGEV